MMPASPWIGSTRNAAVCSLIAASSASMSPYSTRRKPGGKGPKPDWYCGSSDMATMAIVRPWKLPEAGDDLRLVRGHALDRVGPLPRRLDGGLDSFGAGIHRQRHVLAGELAGAGQERAELVRVERARNDAECRHLLLDEAHEPWMRMAVAHRRIGAHHVEVALAILVPDIGAFAPRQDDGQRMVIVRAIARLEVDAGAHQCPHSRPGALLPAAGNL